MKMNILRKGVSAVLAFAMLLGVASAATISNVKFRKGTVTVDYYVGGDNATIWVTDAADSSNVLYVDQEEADGSFSFGIPEDFEGDSVTVRVGGAYEPVASETVSVTPTPAPTPDPESTEAGGIYAYVNKEDFKEVSINYDEKYMVTEADFKEEPNTAAYSKGTEGMIVYDEYSGAEGVFYMNGNILGGETISYSFDPIKSGKAKISIKYMYEMMPYAGSDGEVPFFSILDGSTGNYAVRNCAARDTSSKVPVQGLYFYNGASDYTRYRSYGSDSTWQTLTYIIDMDNKTFDLDYNGTVYAGNSFYSDVTELSKIYFHGSRGQWGSNYYIDEIKVMAEQAEEYATHTVTFMNDDKETTIGTKQIKDGRRLIPLDGPTRRGYTFVGWYLANGTEANFSAVTADMTVYAKYLPRCTVDFYAEDMVTPLASVTVDYAAEAKIANPTKSGYTFMGWVDKNGNLIDLSSVTENLTVYEWYEKQSNIYFYDMDASGNATLYQKLVVDYGEDAALPDNPTSRTDKKFIGWGLSDGSLADLSNIRGDRKVYAIYGTQDSTAVEDFETIISRVNSDAGEEVMTSGYLTGGTYENMQGSTGYKNITMFANSDSRANGLQRGWQTTTVDGSTVWKHTAAIAFNYDNMTLYPNSTATTDFYHISYRFKMDQWQNAQQYSANAGGFGSVYGTKSGASSASELICVTASTRDNRGLAVLNPKTSEWVSILPYNSASPDLDWHTVDYYIDVTNNTVSIALDNVVKATVPVSQTGVSSIDYIYFCLLHGGHVGNQSRFNIDDIATTAYTNSDVTVAPTYYTVTFYAEDGKTVLDTQSVAEGKAAIYGGETPTKESTAELEYTFSGWSQDISSVIDSISVTPVFKASARKYDVTFVIDGKSTVVKTEYKKAATAPTNPTKASTAQYEYTFEKWDKAFDSITEDITVTAIFKETVRSYNVTFYDDDKTTVLKSESVKYGEAATAPENPTKEGTDKVSYTFKGWVDASGKAASFSSITGETKLYASYEAKYATKTIKFLWGDVNGDGAVTGTDATAIKNALTNGTKTYKDYTIGKEFANGLLWGDINGDGAVTGTDATAIKNALTNGTKTYKGYTIGKEATFEIPVD